MMMTCVIGHRFLRDSFFNDNKTETVRLFFFFFTKLYIKKKYNMYDLNRSTGNISDGGHRYNGDNHGV